EHTDGQRHDGCSRFEASTAPRRHEDAVRRGGNVCDDDVGDDVEADTERLDDGAVAVEHPVILAAVVLEARERGEHRAGVEATHGAGRARRAGPSRASGRTPY